jgi:hypothetical protein
MGVGVRDDRFSQWENQLRLLFRTINSLRFYFVDTEVFTGRNPCVPRETP